MSKKLLLADDSITIQKVIGITFANEDYELTIVDNGDTALEKARIERPDLILADVFMPGKNGYELCAAVRREAALGQVPVLLLTGTFEPFDENKARAAGADSWIAKPFESQALIDRVEELLARVPQPAPVVQAPATAPVVQPAPQEPPPVQEIEADFWGELADIDAAEARKPPVFAGEEAPPVALKEPVSQPAEAIEEDIWGTISFDEDELAEEPLVEAEEMWSAPKAEKPVVAAPVPAPPEDAFFFEDELPAEEISTSLPSADTFFFEDEIPGEEVPPPAFEAPPVEEEFLFEEEESFAPQPPSAEWGEQAEEILPLDEIDILEEEALGTTAEIAAEDEFIFGEEEPATPETSIEFGEEPAFDEAFSLTEEGPEWGIAEGPLIGIEPSTPAAEEVFITPAEAAMEQQKTVAPIAAVGVEERVRSLSEDELAKIVERVAGSVIERLAGSLLEKIAWEVVPDLAENLVREEIRKIREGAQ